MIRQHSQLKQVMSLYYIYINMKKSITRRRILFLHISFVKRGQFSAFSQTFPLLGYKIKEHEKNDLLENLDVMDHRNNR